ncbi:MAG: DsbA family protein [Candidatus Doudnabacteria bacterium]
MTHLSEYLKKILRYAKDYSWVASLILSIAAFGFSAYNLKQTSQKISSIQNVDVTGAQVAGANVDIKKFISELKGDEPVLGSTKAPLTIVEFADFQCPFCKRFFEATFPDIKQKYISTGKVKLIFIDLAFLGQESKDAGEAAKCAGDQGQFWQYHDYLFANQLGENQGNFSINKLKGFALNLKLDTAQFNACLDSHKYQNVIDAQTQLAHKYGATATPTFFINDKVIKGALPAPTFESVIDGFLSN